MLLTGQILILLTLEATAKEVRSHFLHLDHTGETINYGWNHGLKSSFKFTVMFGITINFTDKMIQEGDKPTFSSVVPPTCQTSRPSSSTSPQLVGCLPFGDRHRGTPV
jgi:hypothetical protein